MIRSTSCNYTQSQNKLEMVQRKPSVLEVTTNIQSTFGPSKVWSGMFIASIGHGTFSRHFSIIKMKESDFVDCFCNATTSINFYCKFQTELFMTFLCLKWWYSDTPCHSVIQSPLFHYRNQACVTLYRWAALRIAFRATVKTKQLVRSRPVSCTCSERTHE